MSSFKTQNLWRPDAALALLLAIAGMVVLWAAGLSEVAWAPPFVAAVEMGRRRQRPGCAGPAPHAQ